MDQLNTTLDGVIQALASGNVAIPLIFGIATLINGIWHRDTGISLTVSQIADKIASQVQGNKIYGEAEIAHLEAIKALQ